MKKLFEQGDNALHSLAQTREKALVDAYKSSLKEVQGFLDQAWKKYASEGKLSVNEMSKYNRFQYMETQIAGQLKQLNVKTKKIVRESLREGATQAYNWTGYAVEAGTGVNFKFGLIPKAQIEAAIENEYDKIGWPNRTNEQVKQLNTQVRQAVTQSMILGESYENAQKRLTDVMNIGAGKAMRILRTETHRAQVEGRLYGIDKTLQGAKLLGVRTHKIWVNTKDDRTRDSHQSMGDVKADKDGLFTLPSGVKTRGPGLSGVAEEDINCRCTVRLVFPDYKPDYDAMEGMDASAYGMSCLIK